MGHNRDLVLKQCNPAMELGFSLAEFKARLQAIRQRMAQDKIDLLWLTAPESLYYVSGYTCEWYQAQSPKQWPATSGIAIHVDHDRFIMFGQPGFRSLRHYQNERHGSRTRDRQEARRRAYRFDPGL